MKVLLLNGSPRQGNTYTALNVLKRGMQNISDLEITEIRADDVTVASCKACEFCTENGFCVCHDDTNEIVTAAVTADAIVFATPVYWWGVTAQLKVIVDKFYSQGAKLHELKKKTGLIVIGEATQDDPQYEIIPKQFQCICDYLGWEMAFFRTYTAAAADDLSKDDNAIKELESLWESLL